MLAGMTYYEIASYFIIYSFIGWCVEVIYHAVKVGKVINRGFLCGPVCPVYGFGILAVFAMTKSVLPSLANMSESRLTEGDRLSEVLIVFLCCMILATAVELAAGWILDMAFHARWWDYSKEPFNLNGYICLRFSMIWGAAGVFVVRIIQPVMENASAYQLPEKYGWPLLAAAYAVYLFDFIVTVMIVAGMNKQLEELDEIKKNLRRVSDDLSERIGGGTIETQQKLEESRVQAALAGYEFRDELEEKRREYEARKAEIRRKSAARRLEFEKQMEELSEKAEERRAELEQQRAKQKEELEKQMAEIDRQREAFEQQVRDMLRQRTDLADSAERLKEKMLARRFAGSGRLLNAFPRMKHRKFQDVIKELQNRK